MRAESLLPWGSAAGCRHSGAAAKGTKVHWQGSACLASMQLRAANCREAKLCGRACAYMRPAQCGPCQCA